MGRDSLKRRIAMFNPRNISKQTVEQVSQNDSDCRWDAYTPEERRSGSVLHVGFAACGQLVEC